MTQKSLPEFEVFLCVDEQTIPWTVLSSHQKDLYVQKMMEHASQAMSAYHAQKLRTESK